MDDQAVFLALSSNRVFGPCPRHVLDQLVEQCSIHSAKRHAVIAAVVVPFPYVGLICSGVAAATLRATSVGRGVHQLHLYEHHAGDLIGEIAFLAGAAPPGEIIVASKHVTYALFPTAAIEQAIAVDTGLLRRLGAHAAGRVYDIAQRLIVMRNAPAVARVARALLVFARPGDGLRLGEPELAEMTQYEIAGAAGCVKESAARAIGELESAGALRRRHGHIESLNLEVLRRYAAETMEDVE